MTDFNVPPTDEAPWVRVRPHVEALATRPEPVTLAEWRELRLNSWERQYLYPRLTVEALADVVRYSINNCSRLYGSVASTYDEIVIHTFAPELLRRLEEAHKELARLKHEVAPKGMRDGVYTASYRLAGFQYVSIEARDFDDGGLPTKWAVKECQSVLSKGSEWVYESTPSNRTEAFLRDCRYNSAEEAVEAYMAWYEAQDERTQDQALTRQEYQKRLEARSAAKETP